MPSPWSTGSAARAVLVFRPARLHRVTALLSHLPPSHLPPPIPWRVGVVGASRLRKMRQPPSQLPESPNLKDRLAGLCGVVTTEGRVCSLSKLHGGLHLGEG